MFLKHIEFADRNVYTKALEYCSMLQCFAQSRNVVFVQMQSPIFRVYPSMEICIEFIRYSLDPDMKTTQFCNCIGIKFCRLAAAKFNG